MRARKIGKLRVCNQQARPLQQFHLYIWNQHIGQRIPRGHLTAKTSSSTVSESPPPPMNLRSLFFSFMCRQSRSLRCPDPKASGRLHGHRTAVSLPQKVRTSTVWLSTTVAHKNGVNSLLQIIFTTGPGGPATGNASTIKICWLPASQSIACIGPARSRRLQSVSSSFFEEVRTELPLSALVRMARC